jgi:hypothetical protein
MTTRNDRCLLFLLLLASVRRINGSMIRSRVLSSTILFCSICFAISTQCCRAAEQIAGRWEGSVQVPGREVILIVDLAQDNGGAWSGSIIISGLNVKGSPLVDIAVEDSGASFGIKTGGDLQATVKAKLNADNTLSGNFTQAGNTAPFVLRKTGLPQVELPPRSTTIAKEIEGEWTGEYQLLGYPRHVTIKLMNRASNGATAEFVVVGKKTNNLPVDLVTQEGNSIIIDSHETGISYEGRFKKDANEITGTFLQGPIEIPLVLHRAK